MMSTYSLIIQQIKSLLRKNYMLASRNKRATILQILSSVFFISLLCYINLAAMYMANLTEVAVSNPVPVTEFPIPPCESMLFLRHPCLDFVWSGNQSNRIQSIVQKIMLNNPRRPIPSQKVKSFKTKQEVSEWLMKSPNQVPFVLHFKDIKELEISYSIEINSSSYLTPVEDPFFKYQIPFQFASSREIARSLIQDPNYSWNISCVEFAHPTFERKNEYYRRMISVYIVPLMLYAASMFNFIFQTSSMVQEKELKFRQAMTMMGLYDTAYWCSWLIWETLITLISSTLIVVCGVIFRVDLFTKNNFIIVFLLFFLFQLSMVGVAFLLSVFMTNSSAARYVGFVIFTAGLIPHILSYMIYTYHRTKRYHIMWSMFPPSPFARGLKLLGESSRGSGLGLEEISKCSDYDCYSMMYCYKWLGSTCFLWFILALYFDNVIPNSEGVRKSIFYFVTPSYWFERAEITFEEELNTLPPSYDQSIVLEEETVKRQSRHGIIDLEMATIQLRGLTKTYPKSRKHDNPCHAVKGLWLNVPTDNLLCLLGPNDAGKSTLIGCLTGIIPVTRGDALIYGNSIRSPTTLSQIRRQTGVCTQFNTLWEKLSAREHLEICASIKGMTPAAGASQAYRLLRVMQLTEDTLRQTEPDEVRVESFSNGMKRCLSVAIAFLGNPKVVILDEPTTGLDVMTRRCIWDGIENYRNGRSFIVTTHSIEEAEAISDRIGIMVKGQLQCIGSSATLKSILNAGVTISVSFSPDALEENIEAIKHAFNEYMNVSPIDESLNPLSFVVPEEKEDLIEKFLQVVDLQVGITDIDIGSITLKQAYLHFVEQAELQELGTRPNTSSAHLHNR